MSRRYAPTLADYVVIAISPALIMVLVGSLVFFLIEVFYRGVYDVRLNVIMALFIFAAVLIARIAIESGRSYAMLFSIPLGLVTLLATSRLIQYSGPLREFSLLINVALIALIWWCADRLTFDSTVIDESADASGEGLLQTMGWSPSAEQDGSDPPPRATRPAERPHGSPWQRFAESHRRPHAPGVWVIYFSIAALPVFGVGNWFIDSSNLASRRYAFHLLVMYVAAALGLLVTTSFLGLRRYLRQRLLPMPAQMAAAWIGTGVVLIVVLLFVCFFLPRRDAEYTITQLPIFAGSPTDLWTTEYAWGSEGENDPDNADRTGESEPKSQQQQGKRGESSGQGSSGGDGKSSEQSSGKAQGGGKSRSDSGGKGGSKSDESQGSEGQSSSPSDNGSTRPAKRKPSDSSSSQSQGKPGDTGNDSTSEQSGEGGKSDADQPNDSSSSRQDRDEQSGGSGERRKPAKSQRSDRGERQPADGSDQSEGESQSAESDSQGDQSGNQAAQDPPSRSGSSSSSRFDPSKLFSALGGSIGQLLKLLYWLVILLVLAYLAVRYWREIRDAIAQFLRSLRDFWNSLFGRSTEAEGEEMKAVASDPPPKPFAAFSDPFLSGMAQQLSPVEVIRYTFEAFEAWGRERGLPRHPEQTPHEYTQSVARVHAPLSRDALILAELYCRCAYAREDSKRLNVESLRGLWNHLQLSVRSS